ncbi:hypothetical protein DAPPUDRAFT_113020 [Daphnia pulex]|uniref:RanBP2-type domain-containing protein n=1 Tax=Daphnia pulex TaxID=6669 RepID=E9HDU1_DAPPU|nr:hypothetical protein DAPPUDRAFT_113020 [Daphnia pulex]|eukprot:EFX70083.1 hypothetical protein DAPPUDRAFT_113020 [Daphnia pulex]
MRSETTPASVCFTSITIGYTSERQFCVGGGGGGEGGCCGGGRGGGGGRTGRIGDWKCVPCGRWNFVWRSVCSECGVRGVPKTQFSIESSRSLTDILHAVGIGGYSENFSPNLLQCHHLLKVKVGVEEMEVEAEIGNAHFVSRSTHWDALHVRQENKKDKNKANAALSAALSAALVAAVPAAAAAAALPADDFVESSSSFNLPTQMDIIDGLPNYFDMIIQLWVHFIISRIFQTILSADLICKQFLLTKEPRKTCRQLYRKAGVVEVEARLMGQLTGDARIIIEETCIGGLTVHLQKKTRKFTNEEKKVFKVTKKTKMNQKMLNATTALIATALVAATAVVYLPLLLLQLRLLLQHILLLPPQLILLLLLQFIFLLPLGPTTHSAATYPSNIPSAAAIIRDHAAPFVEGSSSSINSPMEWRNISWLKL